MSYSTVQCAHCHSPARFTVTPIGHTPWPGHVCALHLGDWIAAAIADKAITEWKVTVSQ